MNTRFAGAVTRFMQTFGAGAGTGVVCRTGRALLWVSAVRPCRSIADWRTNVETARLATRLEFSAS
jgi:hypothetical protein